VNTFVRGLLLLGEVGSALASLTMSLEGSARLSVLQFSGSFLGFSNCNFVCPFFRFFLGVSERFGGGEKLTLPKLG
jgi:hypothetical protein